MRVLCSLSASLAMFAATSASAAIYNYKLTGDFEATFAIDTEEPTYVGVGETGFYLYNVSGVFGGYDLSRVMIGFPSADYDGGIEASTYGGEPSAQSLFGRDYLFSAAGVTLFSGPLDNPTLLTGAWDLTEYYEVGKSYRLEVTSAAPEPAAWALMISGFGLAGGVLRRRAQPLKVR